MIDYLLRQSSLDQQAVADCLDDGLDLTPDTQSIFAREMRSERARLQTFGHSWPAKGSKQLASYGFYSVTSDTVGPEQFVRCAFCGLELRGVTSAKEAKVQHWRAARSYCSFLKGDDVGNVGADDTERVTRDVNTGTMPAGPETFPRTERLHHVGATPVTSPPLTTHSLVFINHSPSQHPVTSPLRHTVAMTSHQNQSNLPPDPADNCQQHNSTTWADIVRTARYPQMASFQARLDSLRTWPLVKPTARELSRAGLFHVKCRRHPDISGLHGDNRHGGECADSVKCFWCGERFHRWQESDDAMLEHARLSPRCRYVTQILGRQLHDDIIKAGSSHLDNRLLPNEPETNSTEVMESAPVQRVLQMGFPRQLVRELLSHNGQRLSADTLCELVLHAAQQQDLAAGRTTSTTEGTRTGEGEAILRKTTTGGTRIGEGDATFRMTTNTNYGHSSTPRDQPTVPKTGSRRDQALTPAEVTGPPTSGSKVTCKVCSEEEVKVTFRPCNHLVCCSRCARFFTLCPVCQRHIEDRQTTYLA